jgi:hypothetical protein
MRDPTGAGNSVLTAQLFLPDFSMAIPLWYKGYALTQCGTLVP